MNLLICFLLILFFLSFSSSSSFSLTQYNKQYIVKSSNWLTDQSFVVFGNVGLFYNLQLTTDGGKYFY